MKDTNGRAKTTRTRCETGTLDIVEVVKDPRVRIMQRGSWNLNAHDFHVPPHQVREPGSQAFSW